MMCSICALGSWLVTSAVSLELLEICAVTVRWPSPRRGPRREEAMASLCLQLVTRLRLSHLVARVAHDCRTIFTYKCGTFTLDGSSAFLVAGSLDFLIDFEVRRGCAHMRKSINSKLHVISEPCVTIDINIDDMYSIDIST